MELEGIDIGLYVEDDVADTALCAALDAGWLPRYRHPRGELLEVAFVPPTPEETCDANTAACAVPPELTVAPLWSAEHAASTLAAHLARVHPLTDADLVPSDTARPVLLYGWLEPQPASCVVQYAETMEPSGAGGLSAEEEAILRDHLIPHEKSASAHTATVQAGAMHAPPAPATGNTTATTAMPAPMDLLGVKPSSATSAASSSSAPPTEVAPPVFHVVQSEQLFRLHLWSSSHTTRAMQRHLVSHDDVRPSSPPPTSSSSLGVHEDGNGNGESEASDVMRSFFAARASSTTTTAAPPPPPQAKELTERDDTSMVRNALHTVVTVSQLVSSHPDAKMDVLTDASRPGEHEYILFDEV